MFCQQPASLFWGRLLAVSVSLMFALLFALLFAVLFAVSAPAQDVPSYVQREWNEHDGLPVKRLLNGSLLQTSDGYLWIGTRAGLVRFDGLRFETFTTDNTPGLPDNRIASLFESRDGSLWIATAYENLVRYKNRSFTPYFSDAVSTLDPSYVTSFYEDAEGTLWIGSITGVFRFRDETLEAYLPDLIQTGVEDLFVDGEGTMWLAAGNNGLLRVRAGMVEQYTTKDGLSQSYVSNVQLSDDGALWIQHPKGQLSRFFQGTLSPFWLPGSNPEALHFVSKDLRGRLWLSVDDHLYHFHGGQWQSIEYSEGLTGLVPDWFSWKHTLIGKDLPQSWFTWKLAQIGEMVPDAIAPPPGAGTHDWVHQNKSQQMMRDSEDNVWFSGIDRGLIRLKPALFNTVLNEQMEDVTDADAREELNIFAIAESQDGSMWFGALLATLTQRLPDGTLVKYGRPDAFSFPSWAIHEDRAGNLWVNGALCQRGKAATCSFFQPVGPLQSRLVSAITEDRRGNLWFGTNDGLFRLVPGPNKSNPLQGTWTHFTEEDGLSHRNIRVIHEGGDGTLWLGTNGGGITRYGNGSFTQLTMEHGLSSNRISALYEDDRGVLWAGTEDSGLARIQFDRDAQANFSPLSTRITVYLKEHGLYNNGVHSILADDQGRFWMSTKYGIFWVERDALDAFADGRLPRIPSTAYTSRDGLVDQEANAGSGHSGLRTKDGRLWFATQAGAAVANPADVRLNPVPPPVIIETARTLDEPVLIENERIALNLGQRDIEISYTGLSLSDPTQVHFRYRLDGYDEAWVEAGTRRTALYTKVPAGHYTFRVIAANNEGVWNEQGASLAVYVPPFFYETWWLRLLVMLAFLGVVIASYQMRVRSLVQRKHELKQTVEERTRALRAEKEKTEAQAQRLLKLDKFKNHFFENISHEFRTPLTLIIGPLQQLLAGRDGPKPESIHRYHEMMLRNSRRLLRLINQILDLARVESGKLQLDKETQDIVPLLQEAVQVFMPLAERRDITLISQLALQNDGVPLVCKISYDRDKLRKVISNLFSNALKFTPEGGQVTVTLKDSLDFVEIKVADTGPGIPPDMLENIFDRFSQLDRGRRSQQEGSGIGLSIVKEFVELHGGTVHIRSTIDVGSTFTIELPKPDLTESTNSHTITQTTSRPLTLAPDDGWLVLEPDLLPVQDNAPSESHGASSDRVTVLVVEDNTEVRLYIRSILEIDYRVLEAHDGAQGLEVAREALPDLIIADVMMPHLDGLALNRALKQEPDLACVPVILLTAKAAPADQVAGLETGADAYVTKPFDPDVLAARVHALLRTRHRLRDQLVQNRLAQQEVPEKEIAPDTTSLLLPLREKARQVVLDNLANATFNVDHLAELLTMSRWQLRRRLVDETGLSPTLFIRQVRLEEAAKLLRQRAGNVSEIAFAVGFQSLSHFSRSFRTQFDVTPSVYLEGDHGNQA